MNKKKLLITYFETELIRNILFVVIFFIYAQINFDDNVSISHPQSTPGHIAEHIFSLVTDFVMPSLYHRHR